LTVVQFVKKTCCY